ncbi:hypothetical protein P5641_02545 [Bacillus subtilis]|nr:hypothetical protein [Bacillus subtilis]MED3695413.1 hypothetical protein [Bacillus subtilis]WEY96757.1 hypothetical protein P5641_02545 [Bacillus subtilis]
MKKWKDIHPISWTIIIGTIFGRMATSMSIPFLAIPRRISFLCRAGHRRELISRHPRKLLRRIYLR